MGKFDGKLGILKKLILILVSLSSILIAILLCVFVTYQVIKFNQKETNQEYESYSYQSYSVDRKTKTSSFGFVTTFQSFGDEDFYTFNEGEDEYRMYSKIGLDEYQCKGTCYCSSPSRRTSGTMSRGIFVLVAAIGSYLAFEIAQEMIDSECRSILETECEPLQAIKSEVTECKDVIEMEKTEEGFESKEENNNKNDPEEDDKKKEKKEPPSGKYFCKGRCLTNQFDLTYHIMFKMLGQKPSIPNYISVMQEKANEFGCEMFELEVEMDFEKSQEEFVYRLHAEEKLMGSNFPEEYYTDVQAEKTFINVELADYCQQTGSTYFSEEDIPNEMFQGIPPHVIKQVRYLSLCYSQMPKAVRESFQTTGEANPTVKCRKIPS